MRDAEPGGGNLFRGVDWSRTRAYALGLGGIYLNLEGREGQGIVKADEADALKAEIADGLAGLDDPERGAVAINRVLPREALYHGPYAGESPDLVVHCAGGISRLVGIVARRSARRASSPITSRSGGAIISSIPTLVPGVLFLNRPFRGEGAHLTDLAPTILDALGVPKGPAMEGSSLLS